MSNVADLSVCRVGPTRSGVEACLRSRVRGRASTASTRAHARSCRFTRLVYVALLCALQLSLAGTRAQAQAHNDAQTPPPGYREAIEEAVTEHDAHNYIEAKALFARAHKLFPNARTLRGLGAVSFELQHYAESVTILEQALASKERPLVGPLREETERLLSRARGFIAEIQLTLEPSNTQVIVDGIDEPHTSVLRLEAGKHELEFRAPGFRPEQRRFTVEGGESKTWPITLQPGPDDTRPQARDVALPAPSQPLELPVLPPKRWPRIVGGTLIAFGIGAFVAAAGFSVRRHNRAAEYRATIYGTPHYIDVAHAWTSARPAPYVLGGVASALLTAGALTVLLSSEREAFPWWASTLSAAAGIGLASWGLTDVAKHGTCGDMVDSRSCSFEQEKRDRGGLAALAALPLLAVPVTQLFRRLWAHDKPTSTSFLLLPSSAAQQRSFSLTAHVSF